jgi:hypothetical protein
LSKALRLSKWMIGMGGGINEFSGLSKN